MSRPQWIHPNQTPTASRKRLPSWSSPDERRGGYIAHQVRGTATEWICPGQNLPHRMCPGRITRHHATSSAKRTGVMIDWRNSRVVALSIHDTLCLVKASNTAHGDPTPRKKTAYDAWHHYSSQKQFSREGQPLCAPHSGEFKQQAHRLRGL